MRNTSSVACRLFVALSLFTVGTSDAAAESSVFTETFRRLNPSVWSVNREGEGPRIRVARRQLELRLPPSSSGETMKAIVQHRTWLWGDYDARVDYHLLEWPPECGVKLSLGTEDGSVQRVSESAAGGDVYLTHFSTMGVSVGVPTHERSGKLRLVRVGNLLTAFVLQDGNWSVLRTVRLDSVKPVRLHLAIWSHEGGFSRKPARVAFDNFTVRHERVRPSRG